MANLWESENIKTSPGVDKMFGTRFEGGKLVEVSLLSPRPNADKGLYRGMTRMMAFMDEQDVEALLNTPPLFHTEGVHCVKCGGVGMTDHAGNKSVYSTLICTDCNGTGKR